LREKKAVDFREALQLAGTDVKALKKRCEFFEKRSFGVGVGDGMPVRGGPRVVGDEGFRDFLIVFAFDLHGYGEPGGAVGGFDAVTVAPVAAGELHAVENNQFIHRADEVKIALPRNVIGLCDGDGLGGGCRANQE